MKKITAVLAASFIAVAFSSNADAQISVGVGYGVQSHYFKVDGKRSEAENPLKAMSGFYLGATYDWNFMQAGWGELALQPGLTYSFYGKKTYEINVDNASYKSYYREHYLDVPVNVKYSYDILPGKIKAHAYAGPVFSFGLASTSLGKVKDDTGKSWERINNYNGNVKWKDADGKRDSKEGEGTDYSMFDLKLGLGIGATVLDMFDVKIGYNIGLLNRYTGDTRKESKESRHTNVFYIGVAYSF